MYKVVKAFHDLKDVKKTKSGNVYYEYNVGDTYPRNGLNPSEERIAELSGSNNLQKTPLIELVEEENPETPKEAAKDESQDPSPKKAKSGKSAAE